MNTLVNAFSPICPRFGDEEVSSSEMPKGTDQKKKKKRKEKNAPPKVCFLYQKTRKGATYQKRKLLAIPALYSYTPQKKPCGLTPPMPTLYFTSPDCSEAPNYTLLPTNLLGWCQSRERQLSSCWTVISPIHP